MHILVYFLAFVTFSTFASPIPSLFERSLRTSHNHHHIPRPHVARDHHSTSHLRAPTNSAESTCPQIGHPRSSPHTPTWPSGSHPVHSPSRGSQRCTTTRSARKGAETNVQNCGPIASSSCPSQPSQCHAPPERSRTNVQNCGPVASSSSPSRPSQCHAPPPKRSRTNVQNCGPIASSSSCDSQPYATADARGVQQQPGILEYGAFDPEVMSGEDFFLTYDDLDSQADAADGYLDDDEEDEGEGEFEEDGMTVDWSQCKEQVDACLSKSTRDAYSR